MVDTKGSDGKDGPKVGNVEGKSNPAEDPTLAFKSCCLSYTKNDGIVKLSTVCEHESDGKEAIKFIEGMLDSKEILITPPKIIKAEV